MKSKETERMKEMESKDYIADFSFGQFDVNVVCDALHLEIKGLLEGLKFSRKLKIERLDMLEEREEKFQSEGLVLRENGNEETSDYTFNFDFQLRYSGTTKLEDPKVWEGSSEFRPWISQKCVNNEDPSSHLLTVEMEGITFKEVKGTWKLNVQLTIKSKSAKHLPLMHWIQWIAKGIKTGSAGELLGTEAMEKEKDGVPFSGLDASSDPGTPKELKPSTAHGPSSGPAEELKPLTGLPVSPDPGKITLSSGPGVGKKLKKRSHEEYGKCPKIGRLLKWIVAFLLPIASKKEIWRLFIFCIIVSQVEGCETGALLEEIKLAKCSTQLENPISCKGNLSSVCLFSVPNNTHAWGCAPDICLNGNVCAEWNILKNGSYVVQGTSRNCSGCPPHYQISQLREEFPNCYKSSQEYPVTEKAPTTKNEQATSAGVIVAGVIAGCVPLVLLIIFGVYLWRKKRSAGLPICQSSGIGDKEMKPFI